MSILDEIAGYAKLRVEENKKSCSLDELKKRCEYIEKSGELAFEKALGKKELSYILECKKASPSKGIIAEDFDYMSIAKEYEKIGADAISVLTEPKWFLGSDEYLRSIAAAVKIPVLRKDFVVDEYMIYEAKILGASAVLLIVSILSKEQLREYIDICKELELSALVEIHDETESVTAIEAGAKIIGVNNRNLADFSVDTGNAGRLRDKIPKDIIFVSESGVKKREDIEAIRSFGADAVLIGETMMRATDKVAMIAELKRGSL